MKSFLHDNYTRLPLIIGCVLNIILTATLFYYSCYLIYDDFSLKSLLIEGMQSLNPKLGINEQMAFSLFISFIAYSISSVFISIAAIIKKEPLYFSILTIINFFIGAFKLIYDFFQISDYPEDTKLLLWFVLISAFTFIFSNAIFESTLRKHHKPKISLIFDLLMFIPVFLPNAISFIQEKVFHQTDNLLIVFNQESINLLTSIAWIGFPCLILLYCGQFSASAGFKKETNRFEKAKPLVTQTSPSKNNNLESKVVLNEEPITSNPTAIAEFIKEESQIQKEKTPVNNTVQLGTKDESLAMFSKSKILFTTQEFKLDETEEEELVPEEKKEESSN